MLTLLDTLAVIVSKVENVLSNCSVSSQDLAEGFERNTMYIYFDGIRQNDYMKKFVEKKVKIIMIYFPTDERKNSVELLEVQEKIMNLFTTGVIKLKDGVYANIDDIYSFRHDGTMHFECDAYIFEEYDEVEYELMEELTHKEGVK